MQETITIWRITPDNMFENVTIHNTLDHLQAEVGGLIEFLMLEPKPGRPAAHGYCNEEGKLLGLPVNTAATVFFAKFGRHNITDPICGTVVVVGDGEEGDDIDAPEWVSHAIDTITNGVPGELAEGLR